MADHEEEAEMAEIEIDIAEWKKLKVAELRNRVAELGIDSKGTKTEIIARVEKYLNEQDEDLLEELEEEEEEEGGAIEEEPQENGEEAEEQLDKSVTEVTPDAPVSTNATINSSDNSKPVEAVANNEVAPPTKKPTTENEKIKNRAQRFGAGETVAAKKLARTERFGATAYVGLGKRTTEPTEAELARLKKRAERFGSAGGSSIINNMEVKEKKQDRIKRFGMTVKDLTVNDRKEAREERFSK